MTFDDLANEIAKMTPAQRSQEVAFVYWELDKEIHTLSLATAAGDIFHTEPDETGDIVDSDDVAIPAGMPYLE